MKALPCATQGCSGAIVGGGVRLPGIAALPAELRKQQIGQQPNPAGPYLLGRAPLRFPYVVSCASCGRPTTIALADWTRLPDVSTAQLEEWGLLDRYLKDLVGDGLPRGQAVDLLERGWSPVTLAEEFGTREQPSPHVDRAQDEALLMSGQSR